MPCSAGLLRRVHEPDHGDCQRRAAYLCGEPALLRWLPAALEEHPQLLEVVRSLFQMYSTAPDVCISGKGEKVH